MLIRSGLRCLLGAAFSTSLLLGATTTLANGRFPRGEHLIEHPSDPKRLTLAATYGILTSDDGGQSWYYTCETAFSLNPPPLPGDPGFTGDPLVTLMPDESLLVGVQKRITMSSDRACGWQKVFEDSLKSIDDIAIAPSNHNTVVALVSNLAGGTNSLQLYQSTNAGVTWAAIGTPLPVQVGYTLDVDPKDPAHIYVTGLATSPADSGVFLSTSNSGMTWTVSTIPKTSIDAAPYIAAVHPTDPKKIFVRTNEWLDNGSVIAANDALLYSKDGGQTWTELLRPVGPDAGAKLFAFALSPDGNTVLAGFGDPVQGGGQTVDRTVTGVYKSSGADYSFGATPTRIVDELVSCLTWTNNGVYMCGSPDGGTSYIGFVKDVSQLSNTGLMKIMKLNETKGPSPCCNGRARTTCDWSVDCVRFQSCGTSGGMVPPYDASACVMPDAGSSDAKSDTSTGGAGGSSTTGGAGAEAGTNGGAGGSSSGGSGGAAAGSGGSAGGSSDGCGCHLAGSNEQGPLGRFAFMLAALAAAGMRRGRRPKQPRA